jgi:hypothetical protein
MVSSADRSSAIAGLRLRMFPICSTYSASSDLSKRFEVVAVVYRKGELSKGTIDREWPHQVALRADRCSGRNYGTIRLFCEGLSLCLRGHFFRRNDVDYTVFCFADREHAEQFQVRFGGEFIDPKARPRWPRNP